MDNYFPLFLFTWFQVPGINDSNILPVLLRESLIPSVGRFLAYSDDKVHAIFLDGVTLTLNWNFASFTEKGQVSVLQTEIHFLLFFNLWKQCCTLFSLFYLCFLKYKICQEALLISLDFQQKLEKCDKQYFIKVTPYRERDQYFFAFDNYLYKSGG